MTRWGGRPASGQPAGSAESRYRCQSSRAAAKSPTRICSNHRVTDRYHASRVYSHAMATMSPASCPAGSDGWLSSPEATGLHLARLEPRVRCDHPAPESRVSSAAEAFGAHAGHRGRASRGSLCCGPPHVLFVIAGMIKRRRVTPGRYGNQRFFPCDSPSASGRDFSRCGRDAARRSAEEPNRSRIWSLVTSISDCFRRSSWSNRSPCLMADASKPETPIPNSRTGR